MPSNRLKVLRKIMTDSPKTFPARAVGSNNSADPAVKGPSFLFDGAKKRLAAGDRVGTIIRAFPYSLRKALRSPARAAVCARADFLRRL